MVARTCDRLDVPHATLTARWSEQPKPRSRSAREPALPAARLLGRRAWARCARHRASRRGPGRDVAHAPRPGLRGQRPRRNAPALGFARRAHAAGSALARLAPRGAGADFRRCRSSHRWPILVTRTSGSSASVSAGRWPGLDWLDAGAVAQSAAHLADADAGLDWAARTEWNENVYERRGSIAYRPSDAPGRDRQAGSPHARFASLPPRESSSRVEPSLPSRVDARGRRYRKSSGRSLPRPGQWQFVEPRPAQAKPLAPMIAG